MPTYVYTGCACYPDKTFGTVEKNVPIADDHLGVLIQIGERRINPD